MATLDWYGLGALVLIALVFYFVRKIPMYIALCGVICVGFVAVTASGADFSRPSEWIVMKLALLASSFGLLIVRVMLIRSISLNLLRNLDKAVESTFTEDLGRRLGDMRKFGLIEAKDEAKDAQNALTAFGRLVGGVVGVFYSLLRIGA
jgi:hypothetical protein